MIGKEVVKNYIRHATIHNKIVEESLCWKEYKVKQQLARKNEPRRSRSSSRQRYRRRRSRSYDPPTSRRRTKSRSYDPPTSKRRTKSRSYDPPPRRRTRSRSYDSPARRRTRSRSCDPPARRRTRSRSYNSSARKRRRTRSRSRTPPRGESRHVEEERRLKAHVTMLLSAEERKIRQEIKRTEDETAEMVQRNRREGKPIYTGFDWQAVASGAVERWGHDGYRELYENGIEEGNRPSGSTVNNSSHHPVPKVEPRASSSLSDESSRSKEKKQSKKSKKRKSKKDKKKKKKKKSKHRSKGSETVEWIEK